MFLSSVCKTISSMIVAAAYVGTHHSPAPASIWEVLLLFEYAWLLLLPNTVTWTSCLERYSLVTITSSTFKWRKFNWNYLKHFPDKKWKDDNDIVTKIMLRHLHNLVVVIVTGILSGTKHGHGPACGHYQDDSCLVLNRMMVRNFAGIEVSTNSKHLP